VDLILERLVDLKADGSFRLDMSYFDYCHGLTMTSKKFDRLFGGPPRAPSAPIAQREMDLAASIQWVTEEVMLRCARHVHARTKLKNLCLAGGVALNCVANGRILREGPFENVWIQPAADDAGGALGVALFIWHQLLGNERLARAADAQRGSFLGPAFPDGDIRRFLDGAGARYEHIEDEARLCDAVASRLAAGKVVGWFQGRMEFGPRALGARSILGDPRRPEMQAVINQKVKFREGFRPFAPAVLAERAAEFFEVDARFDNPYMLLVAPVTAAKRRVLSAADQAATGIAKLQVQRSTIPAVTHVDDSARIQTVDLDRHGLYRRLLEAFDRQTGCPVLVNTSFNLGWDPIVCTPEDAYRTFMSSDIDVLCMGHFLLEKPAQPAWVAGEARDERFLDVLRSPCCGAPLTVGEGFLRCGRCEHAFPVEDGVPRLFWPTEATNGARDVTEIVKAFYEESPFPNYDEHDTVRSLIDKSRRGVYASKLNEAIPFNSTILEVGCGTGQLSNFLGIGCRRVIAADMCLNSLRLGETFRRRHHLDRVRFVQMNLFRPCVAPGAFDVVLCNGVLHHTGDPVGGFRGLVPLVRPGGYIVLGLYNRYGRVLTDLRRMLFRVTGGRGQWLDPQLRAIRTSREKTRAWFADQYRNPHESTHTIGEVLEWFEDSGIEFVRGLPAVTLGRNGAENGNLFERVPSGGALDHFLVQLQQTVTGNREGGFFVLIGRKSGPAPAARVPGREGEAIAWHS
jgi:SAM-dependent methyltransferase